MEDEAVKALPVEAQESLRRMLAVRRELDQDAENLKQLSDQFEQTSDESTAATTSLDGPAIRKMLNREIDRSKGSPRNWPSLIAIAAGLALLLWGAGLFETSPDRPLGDGNSPTSGTSGGTLLSTASAIEPQEPKGQVREWKAFRWQGELPPFSRFVVHVWQIDADTGASQELSTRCRDDNVLLSSPALTAAEWTPDVELPDRLAWRVDVVPFEGAAIPGTLTEAWKE